mmetsp:Transcript_120127/g.212056  ORF Transcript_120127/g.212056 Transcript_120127/m.212056 type:complete len:84 (-) Transcript_120127:527-778(-)
MLVPSDPWLLPETLMAPLTERCARLGIEPRKEPDNEPTTDPPGDPSPIERKDSFGPDPNSITSSRKSKCALEEPPADVDIKLP